MKSLEIKFTSEKILRLDVAVGVVGWAGICDFHRLQLST